MPRSKSIKAPAASAGFEWLYVALCAWFLGGLYFDAWSHTHHPELETFFNVPHSVLYSGFLMLAALVLFTAYKGRRDGRPWRKSMPSGYQTAFWGTLLFMVSGIGDAIWHTLFGIEHQLEAAFSPTHIGIMVGLTILVSAPFMAAWRRGTPLGIGVTRDWPALLGFTYLLSGFTLVTQWAHPYVEQVAATAPLDINQGQALGILGIILQVVILVGLALLILKRGIARPGVFTLAIMVNAFVLSLMRYNFEILPAALITGLAMDLFLHVWQRRRSTLGFRIFALASGVIFTLSYFGALFATRPVWWSVHMWAGSVVVAGIFGLLVSYLVSPPPVFAGSSL